MEGQPSVFLPVTEQSSRPQGSPAGGSPSGGGGGGAGGGATGKRAGSDVAVAASVESVTAGVTSLAGITSSSTSSSISGGPASAKRTRSSSAEGCHRGLTEAVLMVQKGKLPKLDPLEDQVKADYADYRADVTRRALHILTEELPRRIANFLKVVDVNAPPGTLLVCDDLAAPPPLQKLLSDEQLTKLRSSAAAVAGDSSKSGEPLPGARVEDTRPVAAAGGQAAAQERPTVLAASCHDTKEEGPKEKQQSEGAESGEKGEQDSVPSASSSSDVEVLTREESCNLTQWLETKVGELYCPNVKPMLLVPDTTAPSAATLVSTAGAVDAADHAAPHTFQQASGAHSPNRREKRKGHLQSGGSGSTDATSSSSSSSSCSDIDSSRSSGGVGGGSNSDTSVDSGSGSCERGGDHSSTSSSGGVGSSCTGGDSKCNRSSGDEGGRSSNTGRQSNKNNGASLCPGDSGDSSSERRKCSTACQQLAEQAAFVKKEAVAMRELLNAVKLFMQLHVPRIEDGNNFGVAIQEEAIHLLNRVEESAFNLYDTVMKYFLARAKLCSKLVKYPNTMDYQMAITELDKKGEKKSHLQRFLKSLLYFLEAFMAYDGVRPTSRLIHIFEEWIHLKITKLDLRNNYIMLYDLICKNWQNVVAPKGRHYTTSQAHLMY